MQVKTAIDIARPRATIWPLITEMEQATQVISSVIRIDILEKPTAGLVGLTWRETRKMFGKEASEVMWITEAVPEEYYCTRAESHGSVYHSKLSLKENNGVTTLSICFSAEAQSLMAKIMSALLKRMIIKSIKTALQQDLADIKRFAEQQTSV